MSVMVGGDRQVVEESQATRVPLSWLTGEVALYGLILLVGLVLRLADLGRWPLLRAEADTALAAVRTLQGSRWRPLYYLPLLYDANLVLFGLLRPTDATARLVSALTGAAMIGAPYFARDLLGRKGALAASLLLALSPTWVFFSRAAEGSVSTAAVSALLVLLVVRYVRDGKQRYARWAALALGLGLTAGPGLYTLLVALAVFLGVWGLLNKHAAGGLCVRLRDWVGGAAARGNLLLLFGAFLLLSTGFSINPAGFGASIELAGRWIGDLRPTASGLTWFHLPRALVLYELLTVVLSLFGLWRCQRSEPFDVFLISWLGLALVLGIFLGHRDPSWFTDALLPLVFLAARGAEWLLNQTAVGADPREGIAAAVGGVLLLFAYLELASFLHTGQSPFLLFAGLGFGALLLALGGYAFWIEGAAALRVGGILLLAGLLMGTVRATVALAYQTGRNPRESVVHEPVSIQLRDLEATISTLSSRRAGDPHVLDITYEETLDPWMAWYLRDYPKARAVGYVGSPPQASVLVTEARPTRERWATGYARERFRLHETWPTQALSIRQRLRWLLYRDPVGVEDVTEIELWVRLPQVE